MQVAAAVDIPKGRCPILRNLNELKNQKIGATAGEIGRVKGFYFQDDAWVVRYLVVEAGSWLSSRKVLIAQPWIKGVHWADQTVAVDLSREAIQNAPPYDATLDWRREQELVLYRHHGRRGYWPGSINPEDAI